MSHVEAKSTSRMPDLGRDIDLSLASIGKSTRRGRRLLPSLITLGAVCVAVWSGRAMWGVYMDTPWTRDGTVRAYVVTMAPEVSGRITALPVSDNQYIHKGDALLTIEPTDYVIAMQQAQAAVDQARVNAENAQTEARRRERLTDLATSQEEKQSYSTNAAAMEASYNKALADLAQARVNLDRTTIRSPVNGYVTNLMTQVGDYATVGKNAISIVNADSFWVDGYFEETEIDRIHVGDAAKVKLMGYSTPLPGHVESIARGITVANAEPGQSGLANVNPIYTWVRLAQRVPVRVHIDQVPDGVHLVAGETATVEVDPKLGSSGS